MRTLRSRRFLRCFYCGQRSKIRFEAQKSFDCSNCDATNWLDQNGEITDPPAIAESPNHSHVQYAIPGFFSSRSPPRSPSPLDPAAGSVADDSVFCATCLRNQHILSRSLAHFEWPDDPTSAENRVRERKYWALRKDLEKRYPQVCEECLPKVNKKLHNASYTAQTDYLRRMMERTRLQRTAVNRRGPLDLVDFLGKSSWHAGFVLQAAWHLAVVSLLLTELYAPTAWDGHWISATLARFHRMSASTLPYTDRLMQWAINLGVCSFPWNPRFKQSIRGFTAHILGFRQWYTYQLLVLLVRFIALSIAQYSRSQGLPATAQLGAQLVIPLLMVHVYLTAKKSIHTDTFPLFRQPVELTAASRVGSDGRSAAKDSDDLGNVLDEILHSSTPHGERAYRSPETPISQAINGIMKLPEEEPHITQDDDEMDWSPSASQHRAFSSYNPYKVKNPNPRFTDAPIEPKPGPIWYKVPPAPTNPAQRLRNPPMRPIIRETPKEKKEAFFQSTGRPLIDLGSRPRESSAPLNFAPPKFFAPQPKDDPRDGLSSMFANSFNISPSPEGKRRPYTWKSGTSGVKGDATIPNRTMTRAAELAALLAALCGWIFALDSQEHYGRSVALASICVCLMVSVRLVADLEVDHQIRGGTRPSVLTPSFVNLAVAQAIVIMLFMWNIWSGSAISASSGVYGNTLFGGIILHHMLHIFA
ncbi:hypothetical protein F4824DRAFT_459447 [Ustulina deusta]|nr:hypothetical protein F4824DRAFT_459447 [Ustulina deusta]